MDCKLVGWARAVKRRSHCGAGAVPVLWLFTDEVRLGDPRAAAAALPRGLCGVVLRHDGIVGRAALATALAHICRERGNALVVAGDASLARAVGAGVHLRDGKRLRGMRGLRGWVTSSAHGIGDVRRAAAAGADVAFLSPAFATDSHPGAGALGPVRWRSIARTAKSGLVIGALGGIDGQAIRRLGRIRSAAAIKALAP